MLRFILILSAINLMQAFPIQSAGTASKDNTGSKVGSLRAEEDEAKIAKLVRHIFEEDRRINDHLDKKLNDFRQLYYHIADKFASSRKTDEVRSLKMRLFNEHSNTLRRVPRRIKLNRMEDNEVLAKKQTSNTDNDNKENNYPELSSDYLVVDNFYDYNENDNDEGNHHSRSSHSRHPVPRSRKCCDFKNFLMKAIYKRKTEEMKNE